MKLLVYCVVLLVIICSTVNSKYVSNSGRKEVAQRCKTIKLKHGRTRYRQKSGFLQSTCDSGYILAGDKYMKCQNGSWEGVQPVCVRDTCKPQRDPVDGFVYPSHRGGVLNFFCKPGFELNGPTTAFCDGENWSTHLPICTQSNKTVSISCDFESPDICGWTHDLNHNFDWIRHNRETPSAFIGTGPSYDHTYGFNQEGYYMYIEASRKNPSDTARLISPVYRAQNTRTCLQFWYHMYGATMGELRVYVHNVSRTSWIFDGTDSLWTKTGNHGNQWLRGFVDLGILTDNFQIIFEAVRGGNYMSDTALDDVKLIENCEDFDEEETTSTTDEASTDDGQEYLQSWSCYNRCGLNLTEYAGYPCSCLWDCYDQHSCCPDYLAYCFDAFTYDDTSSSSLDTSRIPEEEAITMVISQTNEIINDVVEVPIPTGQDASFEDHETPDLITSKIITPSTISNPTLTINTTTQLTTEKTTTSRRTPPSPRLALYTKPTFQPVIRFTLKPTTNLSTKLVVEPATIPLPKQVETHVKKDSKQNIQENEVLRISETTNENLAIKSAKKITTTSVERGVSIYGVAIIATTILISIVILIVGIKMRRRVVTACQSMRMRRGTSYDSQSDVRFLTSDEILDFSLASSTL